MNKILLISAVLLAVGISTPAQAQSVAEAARSIQSDIRDSLVIAPVAPAAPVSVADAIRAQGRAAIRDILLQTEVTMQVNTNVATIYEPPARSGLVTVSDMIISDVVVSESL